jgi:hypothetical protein
MSTDPQANAEERLVMLVDAPLSCAGSPMPIVFADEQTVLMSYLLPPYEWSQEGTPKAAIFTFFSKREHRFGPPNDEAIGGHRLASIGLRCYRAYEVLNSKLIAGLRAQNRVHPSHSDELFAKDRHFIFTFHDTTFEVVAHSYSVDTVTSDPIEALLPLIAMRRARS